jgi:hypothetical protein
MPLNFTGRAQPAAEDPPPAGRTQVVLLACFGAAAVLAALVFATALRQHKVETPSPAPPLVGTDSALAATAPSAPAAAPQVSEPWILHSAAQQAPPASPREVHPSAPPAAQPPSTPAGPRPLSPAVAKARMLAALRQVPHGTVTLSVEDDAGAAAYARKLADLFREAGWTVEENSAFGPGPARHGLAAAFGVSPSDEAVREAFDAVGFQFAPPPRDAGVIRTPEIYVGAP